jgi:plasmid stabilization system protein ParE
VRLRYTSDALSHLDVIYEFLSERNVGAARRIAADIRAAAERLCDFPQMARFGSVSGTHEWVVRGTPYLLVYEIDEAGGEILILAVFHGAQDWKDDAS